jgi:endonuclease/exonuclease/phosphatase family metal-dependent hydrolase
MQAVLTVSCVLLAVTDATAAVTVRLATLNCEFLNSRKIHIRYGLDFDFNGWDDATRTARLAESSAAVAQEVLAIHADVIVLTEVGNRADFQVLRSLLGYPHHALCESTDVATGQYVGVLSRYPLSDVLPQIPGYEFYDAEEDDADSEQETGISKGLRVTFEVEGQKIYLYGLHLKSERGFSEADGQRVAQASIVRRHYLPLLEAGAHVIVAGDLNDKRGDPAIRRIRGRDDIGPDLIQTGIPDYWEDNTQRWTYAWRGERQQIDHILLSRSLRKNIRASAHQPTAQINGRPATDHRALIVEFEI